MKENVNVNFDKGEPVGEIAEVGVPPIAKELHIEIDNGTKVIELLSSGVVYTRLMEQNGDPRCVEMVIRLAMTKYLNIAMGTTNEASIQYALHWAVHEFGDAVVLYEAKDTLRQFLATRGARLF